MLFCQVHFLWQNNLFAKSVFSKGFGKSSALAFFKFKVDFVGKVGLVKNYGAGKIKSVKAGFWFFGRRVFQMSGTLTKRAPDAGDSAQISSIFLRLFIFLAGRLRRPRPSAGNANR